MKTWSLATILIISVWLSSACGPNALPPTPTAASSPTIALVSPTLPPTNAPTVTAAQTHTLSPTLVSGSPTQNAFESVKAALEKNKTLKSYRGEMSGDNFFALQWKGEVRVPDMRYTYTGAFAKDAQVILAQGQVYVQDSTISDSKEWVLVPESKQYPYASGTPRGSIAEMVGDVSYYQKGERASLDGMECDVYVQDKRAVASTVFGFLGNQTPPSEQAADFFEQAEVKLWICADGYIHQGQLKFQLKSQDAGPPPFPSTLLAHIYDLNADIQIVAPTNVKAFPTPTVRVTKTPEPTPTPIPAAAAREMLAEIAKWDVVLTDAFDIAANDWTVDSYTTEDGKANVTKKIADGKYTWTIHANEPLMNHDFPQVPTQFQHGAIAVEARWVSGARDCRYGIEVHGYFVAGNANFLIRPDGAWLISTASGFLEGNHLASGNVPPMQAGQVYRLLVIQEGETLLFFINDEFVTTLRRRGEAANPGLAMQFDAPNQDCVVEFDKFEVRIPPPPSATAHAQVIVSGFDAANAAQFPVGAYDQPPLGDKREIVDGKYRWEILAPRDEIRRFAIPKMNPITDFTASVTIKNVQGPNRAKAGLAFRHTDSENYYRFEITNFGDFNISKTSKDRYNPFASGSNAIKQGEPNRLKIVAIGPQMSFYINDVLVAQLQDAALTEGSVGLVAMVYEPGATGIYEFSDFEVRVP